VVSALLLLMMTMMMMMMMMMCVDLGCITATFRAEETTRGT
jgi:hypothetical protein